jgi:ornithine cyclodeaminase
VVRQSCRSDPWCSYLKIAALLIMPAYMSAPPRFGLKALSIFSQNRGTGLATHQGVVLLFDADQGRPLAIIEAGAIPAVRTRPLPL